jgi:hypothetical protein
MVLAVTSPVLLLSPFAAFGQPRTGAPSLPEPGGAGEAEAPQALTAEEQIDELREQLKRSEDARRKEVSRLSINGYADLGFFAPIGNHGVGWVKDVGNMAFPDYAKYSWTFLGDILATAINSRGEVADLGDAPGIVRYDSVDSDGAAGFIVNEVNLRVGYQIAERALLRTSVNFTPRSGRTDFALGDQMDVDQAELEYVLTADGGTSFFVGKTMPVFGIEYKDRKSNQRFGITPSLIDRYTSGPQLGVKLRSKLFNDCLILAGALSNNTSTAEQFHFFSEIDKNNGKIFSGRIALSLPIGNLLRFIEGSRLEIGGSAEGGPQDKAHDNNGDIWFAGVDLQYLSANFVLKAQAIKGKSKGLPAENVWKLRLRNSGFVEIDWQFLPWLGVMARAENRDAEVTLGLERAYITKEMRFTGGLRIVFNPHAVLKLEYLHNKEYDGVPEFKNDIFTSSLVLAF